jgi:hypothetical protein
MRDQIEEQQLLVTVHRAVGHRVRLTAKTEKDLVLGRVAFDFPDAKDQTRFSQPSKG